MIKKFIEFVRSNWVWTKFFVSPKTPGLAAVRHDLDYLGITTNTVVTVQFADGKKRKFRIFESGADSLLEGAAVRLEFVHPNFGEVMQVSVFAKGSPIHQRIML